MIDCVTVAPVACLNAGRMTWRSASLQVPGKVAATSVPASANARRGAPAARPSAPTPCSRRRRSKVIVMEVPFWCSGWRKDMAGGWRCRLHVDGRADAVHVALGLARFAHLERGAVANLNIVDHLRAERHDGLDDDGQAAVGRHGVDA